ncbi:MAG: hypothetical protein JST43_04350 [Bacteroidetes bacterium]|nr:hypothetical protein [Bacteroidota bacterium]MBS1539947.1 hypothetical protein [Bacteroidota bacterium]
MNKLFLILFIIMVSAANSYSQKSDTIVTMRGSIICSVKEVTPETVAYTNPNESVVYKIEKGAVAWISYGSGRTEKYNDMKNLANITDANDWKKVDVATSEYETRGLHKIDVITTKATAATVYSSANHIQNRAYDKLKIASALLGGNLVYLMTQQTFQGNNVPTGLTRTYRAQISGTVYCSQLLDSVKFKELLQDEKKYILASKTGMRLNDAAIHDFSSNSTSLPDKFQISLKNYEIEKGFIYVDLPARLLEVSSSRKFARCRVLRFDQGKIVLAYRDGASIYNFLLLKSL